MPGRDSSGLAQQIPVQGLSEERGVNAEWADGAAYVLVYATTCSIMRSHGFLEVPCGGTGAINRSIKRLVAET